ncbi:MAG TPA: hypothetical protein VKU82_10745 [Planctomycetaceae bacterium]|nr:hypothetical protein [Planctomycetaceae bacterium]
MNARNMAICTIGGFVVAALLLAPRTHPVAAETGSKGVFSMLKVGQMVEFTSGAFGAQITTYEDAESKPQMKHKIKEIGDDYIALDYDDKDASGARVEFRLPITAISGVTHVGKTTAPKKPATTPKKKTTGKSAE